MLIKLSNLFPVWLLLFCFVAFLKPELIVWFTGDLITLGLGIIMLSMGLTLNVNDFRGVPLIWVLLGVSLQYIAMPLLGYTAAYIFQLEGPMAAGIILVSCCPGGTASNVITYLAKADVPLSVTMTTISTLLAAILTPILTGYLAGSITHVDTWGLFYSTLKVVILPVILGVLIRRLVPQFVNRIENFLPLLAVFFICLIVGSVIGQNRTTIRESGLQLMGAVFFLHFFGFLLGFLISRPWSSRQIARTISIEVGMQNSGLGVTLAKANFSDPLTAVPSAISSVMHSLIGSCAAAVWRRT